MKFILLEGELRSEFGTRYSRRLRKNKKIPVSVFLKKNEPLHLSLYEDDIKKNLNPHHHFYLIKEGSNEYKVFLKNIQKNHLGNAIYQIDFEIVEEGKKFEVKIPIKYVGQPKGILGGGHTEYLIHEIVIGASIENVIEELEVDISELDVGQKLKVSDLKLPKGVVVVKPPQNTVMVIIRKAIVQETKVKEEAVSGVIGGTAVATGSGATTQATQESQAPVTGQPQKIEPSKPDKKGKTEK